MKKIKYLFSAAFLSIILASCSAGWLDVTPGDKEEEDLVVYDLASAKIALRGMYYMIKGSSNYTTYYAADMIYYGDVHGDQMMATGESGRGLWAYEMDYTGTSGADNMWQIPYKVINIANKLIEKMEAGEANGATAEQVNNIIAQCRMGRALAHFDLLRVYSNFYDPDALGVPIVTKPEQWSYLPARNTVGEVFNKLIVPDLEYAIANMASSNGNGYFSKWTAMGLLARAYQYQGMDKEALATALSLINDKANPHSLLTNEKYATDFNSGFSPENLFIIMITGTTDYTDRPGIAYLCNPDGYADIAISENLYNLFEDKYSDDVRKQLLIADEYPGPEAYFGGLKVFVNKYKPNLGESNIMIANIPIMRLSETYLIAAESAFKTGDKQTAADMLNKIILRGNPNAKTETASSISLDRILQERAVELFGEGHRYFDLVRNDMDIVRYTSSEDQGWNLNLQSYATSFNRKFYKAILPIPISEINSNVNIVQNPGY